ncbi:hypothetical protein ACN94_11815 [Gordonia paraffinivorans]|uniref:hypothetical protein n=1 Tax=Gordonia paraffinivorans TaxID=175628 RepID=UPI000D60CDD3|nr:hypothetical protein [Gordonia paraffinivorans]MBY4574271.1 hypothetical protein [Gordonia paraffinivorans]PWD42612.1 hypothetical protein ACN93_13555 [Gordonia paraffinivorans]
MKGTAYQWIHHPTAHPGGRAPGVRDRRSPAPDGSPTPTAAVDRSAATVVSASLVSASPENPSAVNAPAKPDGP